MKLYEGVPGFEKIMADRVSRFVADDPRQEGCEDFGAGTMAVPGGVATVVAEPDKTREEISVDVSQTSLAARAAERGRGKP
jgi:hypothetical protein